MTTNQGLSPEEFFGDGKSTSAAEGLAPEDFFELHKTEGQIRLGGVEAAGKAVAREAAGFGDMLLGLPGAAAGSGAELLHRIMGSSDSTLKGVSSKAMGIAGKDTREDITQKFSPTWFTDLVNHFAGEDGEAANTTHLSKAMDWLQGKISTAGAKVEQLGGPFTKEDVEMFANAAMNFGGAKGAGTLAKRGLQPRKAIDPPKEEAPKYTIPEAATKPDLRAKEDIEHVTGITQTEEASATRKQRRAEARQAFRDDKSYADYLNNWVEEDIRQADLEKTKAARLAVAKGTSDRTQPSDPVTLKAGAVVDNSIVGQRSLDTGLSKIAKKTKFDLTAEERIALRSAGVRTEQLGKADPEFLAGIGLGATGIGLAVKYPDDAENLGVAAIGLGIGGREGFREGESLSSILARGNNTLVTLERLPPNRTEFSKQSIREQLNRQDVTKAERELLTDTLSRWGTKESITAADLAKGVRIATQDFNLKPVETEKFANYGLEEIGRDAGEDLQPKTTIYKLPEHLDVTATNHFNQAGYFGHTRSFVENGRRHVVELQSDLVQHLKQTGSLESRQLEYNEASRQHEAARTAWNNAGGRGGRELLSAFHDTALVEQEALIRLNAAKEQPADAARILPMVKHWDRRLIREALAESAKRGEETIRFATADTVAKVEKWPENKDRIAYLKDLLENNKDEPGMTSGVAQLREKLAALEKDPNRFPPEMQGIYNHYAKDITKFLRNLGGKEVTDSHGHSWIEVSTAPRGLSKGRAQMFGGVTADTLKGVAAVSIGLAVGQKLDPENPIEGAILGAMGGVAAAAGLVPKTLRALRNLAKPHTRIRINDLTNAHEYEISAAARSIWQVQEKIIELAPKVVDRVVINQAIDSGRVGELRGPLAKAAQLAQEFYEKIGSAAQDMKVLEETRDNYTTHLWKNTDKEALNALLTKKAGQMFSPSSRFAKGRLYVTLAEGKAAGLIPLTEDIAEVIGIYGNSLSRAMANRGLLNKLKGVVLEDGGKLALPDKGAPASFVRIDTPALNGWRVHPDIAPSLRFVMEAKDPGAIVNGLSALNTALKRNVVSLSLFHAKALFDAALGAFNNPLLAVKIVAQASAPKIFGVNRYLQQVKTGGAGDLVDFALKSGAKFSYERGTPTPEDVGGNFYSGMKTLQQAVDKTLPGAGTAVVGTYTKVNHAFDNFMWGRLHAALKLEVFAAKTEALLENSAKRGKPLSKEAAGEIAARYTNDVFGGLNWRRMAENATTKWGRDLSLAVLSPKGRMGLQLLMFAPDWTLSTSRAFVKAFGKGSGIKGLISASAEADLYRQQLIRSAFYYVAIGDTINYASSGHHLWENKDPFRVDLGDGRTMQLSKHFTEPFEWLQKPRQTAINKLGQIPKEVAEQILQVDQLQASGRMQPMQHPIRHAVGNVIPFAAQSIVRGEPNAGQRAVASTLGTPIYGHTQEERREIAFRRAEDTYKKHLEELDKISGGPQK